VAVLNKYGTVSYALYRDSTRYENFTFIKDLRYLNRDLSKVVLVDTDESHYAFTPENGLCLPRWDGSADDKTLIELLPFFEALALSDLGDLRPTLSHYAGKDFHSEFIKNQRLLKLQEKETLQKNKDRVERWSFSSLWPSRRNFREAESLVKSVEDEVLAFEKKKKEELQQQKKIPN
jgi:import inner membrane translocase subunit TIM50